MNPTSAHRGFSSLPQDCWVLILEYLSFNDLLSVSTTCKALRASSEPLLYCEINWDWVTPPLRRILRLLRTIISRPDLAPSVRCVSLLSSVCPWSQRESGRRLRGWDLDSEGPWTAPQHDVNWVEERPLFGDVIQKGVDIIHRAQFSDTEEWIQALNDGDAYATVAILLSQLPGIKTLYLDYSFHSLLTKSGELNTFDSLQSVDYGGNVPPPEQWEIPMRAPMPDGFPLCYNQDQFIGWFYLSYIQHLAIWLRDIVDLRTNPRLNLENRTVDLNSLALARSTISEEDVLFLLTRIPKLRKLHLGSLGLDYYPSGFGESHHDDWHEELWEPFHGILNRFCNLRTAEIPANFIIRDDLVTLGETDWEDRRIYDHVHAFLPNWRTATPLLQQITLRLWNGHYEQMFLGDEKELQAACEEAGLPLKVTTDSLLSALWARNNLELPLY
ncbi:F-box protein [Aspergillus glaucus CBS 516.65]|uniref:F-box domain-containing protein n=1 Tax=Aspergillus glaucus CBS 516.65 TaxID=1160497 RepID=A0A1L9VSZ3_ASPGL|nr:hypothetical protein ASPGLDRAFT_72371 [Aspergillus glaucus CBS 516.65]OJJ87027.1 hypothetical protein ASPGLDRAFT_72371 [Aspergillus glaucus CBS 516.65]